MRSELKHFRVLFLILVLAGCSQHSNTGTDKYAHNTGEVIFHPSHEPKKRDAPFSDLVEVGGENALFFLSGQIGMDHSTRTLVEGGMKTETIQTLENIKAVLTQHDLQMTDVVKVMVILDDIEDFSVFNELYITYFPQKPARTTFAAQALARGAKIEIEVVAVKR